MITLSQTTTPKKVRVNFRCSHEFRKAISKAAIDADMTIEQYCQAALTAYSGIPLSGETNSSGTRPPKEEAGKLWSKERT